jgi:hypothetical protein
MIQSYRPAKSNQSKLHSRILYDPKFFIESLIEIVNKDKETVPFVFNPSQVRYYKNRSNRDIILKPRQLGFSTEIMGLFLHDTMFCPNTLSVIVAHTEKDASDLFEKAHFMFNSIPEIFRASVGRSNVRELKFDKVNSKFTIGSAEAKHFGISKTISNLHITEMSHPYYKEDFMIGLLESVPRSGRVVLESTARGEGNIFHRYYLGAKNKDNEFRTHYYRWFEHDEYMIPLLTGERFLLTEEEADLINKYPKYFTHANTISKLKWRREKKNRLGKLFIQEYPEDEDEDSFIKSGSPVLDVEILRAIDKELPEQLPHEIWLGGELYIYKMVQNGARYIIGCDTSEGDINSDFSSAIVLRSFPPPVEQVALLHGRWTPDTFSEKVYKLGIAYNIATIAVERNNHGHAVLLNLSNGIVRNGVVKYPTYPNIFTGPDRKLGWLTGINKIQMIQELAQAIRTGEIVITSKKFIEEGKKFSYLSGSKMGAPSGSYDDIVMAQAIALMGILTGRFSSEFV